MEELSFDMERKQKERYVKENEMYVNEVRFLKDQIRRYQDLLETKTYVDRRSSTLNLCIPTSLNITSNVPNQTWWSEQ